MGVHDPRHPIAVEAIPATLGGRAITRAAIILTGPGCVHAHRTGGCTFCGFMELTTRGVPVTEDDYLAQMDDALARLAEEGPIAEVDVYNSGSFLADEEIPPEARGALIDRLVTLPGLEKILIESRPEHVTAEALAQLVARLGGVSLEVGIGLESADDLVRQGIMKKGIPLPRFEEAAEAIWGTGASLLVYALVKPPGLTDEEARQDAVMTARYLAELSSRRDGGAGRPVTIAYQPAFVAAGTPLEEAYLRGDYTILSLWTVVDIVKEAAPLIPVQVALWDEGLSHGRVPSGCPECDGVLRAALERFNATGDVTVLEELDCQCREARGAE